MNHEENIGPLGGRICTHIDIREACENRDQNPIHYRNRHDGVLHLIL